MIITGTFLDEISHDIPHQNWGAAEWEKDFLYMKAAGIDTVILIRCGYRKFISYPSAYLIKKYQCYREKLSEIVGKIKSAQLSSFFKEVFYRLQRGKNLRCLKIYICSLFMEHKIFLLKVFLAPDV